MSLTSVAPDPDQPGLTRLECACGWTTSSEIEYAPARVRLHDLDCARTVEWIREELDHLPDTLGAHIPTEIHYLLRKMNEGMAGRQILLQWLAKINGDPMDAA